MKPALLFALLLVFVAAGCSGNKVEIPKHPTVYQQVYGEPPPYAEELNSVKVGGN